MRRLSCRWWKVADIRGGVSRRVALPITAVLIAASAWLWHHLPVPTQIYAPFDVHGSLGSPVRGHSLQVTVTRVRVAPIARFPLGEFSTQTISAIGLWLVVDAAVSAIDTSKLVTADLSVGGNTYQPSLRQLGRGFGTWIDPGLPQHGYWVFEVAPALVQPSITGPLQLRVWSNAEERLNSRPVIDLGNQPLERTNVIRVKPYEIGPAT
jgi:hypothetical protein